ncbi:MAG: hypothetical protein HC892_18990 [Saprospiraceae bacterium]|nr:hypothetical protein [Saprospiraceae bacterium]
MAMQLEAWGFGRPWMAVQLGINLARPTIRLFYYVQDLLIDRNGALYASTRSGGLQRSADGGTSWSQALSGATTDLELGQDGDIYVASGIFSTGSVRKSDFSTHGAATGENGNWLNITPAGSFQRIELATAPSDSNRVYLLCQSGSGNGVSNIFRSDNASSDSSITWTSLPVPTIIDQGSYPEFTRGQAWYDLISAVDPNNEDVVYIAGVDALRSTDAGNKLDTNTLLGLCLLLLDLRPPKMYTLTTMR